MMLQKKMPQIRKNRRERTAAAIEPGAAASAAMVPGAGGRDSGGGGFRSGRAARTLVPPKASPSQANTATRSPCASPRSKGATHLLISRAPKPKPMITIPVARPLRSGNHFATVATGVT